MRTTVTTMDRVYEIYVRKSYIMNVININIKSENMFKTHVFYHSIRAHGCSIVVDNDLENT
jgi:hypothetical protein